MRFLKGPSFVAMAIGLCAALAAPAFAADTGTVSGAVFDQTGKPIESATVRIAGDRLPNGRTAQTDANGMYKFEYLPPGTYTEELDKTRIGNAKQPAVGEVDKATTVGD